MKPFPPLTAVVLAGGGSRRMGRDKALVDIDGAPLVARIVAQVRPLASRVLLSAGDPQRYAFLGLETVVDARVGEGPLMGIVAGLRAAETDLVLFVPCDLPEVPVALVHALLAAAEGRDGAAPVAADGRPEPLLAVYDRRLADVAARLLEAGERRARKLWDVADIARVPLPDGMRLANLNTPEELAAWRRRPPTASGTNARPTPKRRPPRPPE